MLLLLLSLFRVMFPRQKEKRMIMLMFITNLRTIYLNRWKLKKQYKRAYKSFKKTQATMKVPD
jgi:hypothetical protein